MKKAAIWLIEFYQKYLSGMKRYPCCKYVPTCSQYALEAFRTRNFFVALGLTLYRVLRCNPFSKGGYDPVPEKKQKAKKGE